MHKNLQIHLEAIETKAREQERDERGRFGSGSGSGGGKQGGSNPRVAELSKALTASDKGEKALRNAKALGDKANRGGHADTHRQAAKYYGEAEQSFLTAASYISMLGSLSSSEARDMQAARQKAQHAKNRARDHTQKASRTR